MTRFASLVFALLLGFVCAASGEFDPAEQVQRAQVRVGSANWSCAVILKLATETPVYPRSVDALVFEYQAILWLYTPYDGTRSLSMLIGGASPDDVNLLAQIRRQIPDVISVRKLLSVSLAAEQTRLGKLANGCFIDSMAALRGELRTGERIQKAALLCYSFFGSGMKGSHTVLFVETASRRYVVDPSESGKRIEIGAGRTRSAMALADALVPWGQVSSARWLPVIEGGARVPAEGMSVACADGGGG